MQGDNRCTLHKTHLEEFKEWLETTGVAWRAGKGDYQVLQVLTQADGWQVVFRKNSMPEHFSVNEKLMPLVREFYRSRQ
jgi:hypothetical protein